jgi:hypothetical protein
MKKSGTGIFAILIGIFLLIEGIPGLSSNLVFGVLATNMNHAVIHIILGIVGIWLGYRDHARSYCIFLGILLLVVGILRFIPGPDSLLVILLNVNPAVAYLNIAVGALALIVTAASRRV